eukprot:COSAG02_NODE_27710_length_604_cov_0.841584_2_plen_135_part_01
MADHEKQDAHETNVAQIKNVKTSKPSKPGASADVELQLENIAHQARETEQQLIAANEECADLRTEMEEQRTSKETHDAELRRLERSCLEAAEKHPAWSEVHEVGSLSPLERTLHDLARAHATGHVTEDVLDEMDL